MWCKVCDKYDLCKNANDKCVICSKNVLYKDYFEQSKFSSNKFYNKNKSITYNSNEE